MKDTVGHSNEEETNNVLTLLGAALRKDVRNIAWATLKKLGASLRKLGETLRKDARNIVWTLLGAGLRKDVRNFARHSIQEVNNIEEGRGRTHRLVLPVVSRYKKGLMLGQE